MPNVLAHAMAVLEPVISNELPQTQIKRTLLEKMQSEREGEPVGQIEQSRPLSLLDLPVDVLQHVISHTTHTNDLCALALTHSSLHSLVIPYIYSRFDIVWPEASPTTDSRVGVDALTYGLATLVMAHDVLGESTIRQPRQICQCCSNHHQNPPLPPPNIPTQIRRGNYFAQYTRKFSLGNGPTDWVSEYSITKEGGKMLGTLVALALGRMRNLEAFIWDMPTGVLRDVWIALASLANRNDGHECRLEKIWVRWHDNREMSPLSREERRHTLPSLIRGNASSLFNVPPYPIVEYPTFSILPALKSITVLDIDEVPYVEELSVLLERSLGQLQELRVGVAVYAQRLLPFRPIDDRSVVPPEHRASEEDARPGGILGILVGRFCQPFSALPSITTPGRYLQPDHGSHLTLCDEPRPLFPLKSEMLGELGVSEMNQLGDMLASQSLQDDLDAPTPYAPSETTINTSSNNARLAAFSLPKTSNHADTEQRKRRLKLQILELERIYLSIPVMSRSLDWSRLESLTLLGCMNHEELWKVLRKTFAPQSLRNKTPTSKFGSAAFRYRSSSATHLPVSPSEYRLRLRRLHTDTVSRSLLDFIKNTLAPDTLEWLFLQRTFAYHSNVKIEDIYRSAVRMHRSSLRKLLIDGEFTNAPQRERDREAIESRWQDWVCHEELISCITSGKMRLRELSVSMTHTGWHYFLKRLPNATSLRSLHISHIAHHPFGRQYDREEIARSILNIIAVRPEIELCYFGIERKCYEILEYTSQAPRHAVTISNRLGTVGSTTHSIVDNDEEDGDEDEGDAAQHVNHFATPDLSDEDDEEGNSNTSSNVDDTDDDEEPSDENLVQREPEFTLREILFYDDKISIFKARHGKL